MSLLATLASLALAPLALQAATPAQQGESHAQLSQENAALLRCAAAFALVSYGQERGNEAALKWPQIDPRGREFFVQALAKLMDETGYAREEVSRLASSMAQRLLDEDQLDAVMPACLSMLEASGV